MSLKINVTDENGVVYVIAKVESYNVRLGEYIVRDEEGDDLTLTELIDDATKWDQQENK